MPAEDVENRGVKNRGRQQSYSSSSYAVDDDEAQWTSWLVPMIVVANIGVFLVAMYVNNCPKNNYAAAEGKCTARFLGRLSFQPLKENPLFGPSSSTVRRAVFVQISLFSKAEKPQRKYVKCFNGCSKVWQTVQISSHWMLNLELVKANGRIQDFKHPKILEKLGALEWTKVVHKHQGWRLVTCIWLHAGIIHLVANMLSLVFIGIRLEQQFGFVRVGIVYLLSGFGGSVLSSLFIRKNISVGASGALFGLLGAMLSELITNWTMYTNKVAALLTLLVIVAINLAIGILPHVDNFAHIGGFLTGFLTGFILMPRPRLGWLENPNVPARISVVKSKYKAYQYVLWILSLVLLIVGFTVALSMLYRGENGNDRCRWCHYLSCVPTSRWRCEEN